MERGHDVSPAGLQSVTLCVLAGWHSIISSATTVCWYTSCISAGLQRLPALDTLDIPRIPLGSDDTNSS